MGLFKFEVAFFWWKTELKGGYRVGFKPFFRETGCQRMISGEPPKKIFHPWSTLCLESALEAAKVGPESALEAGKLHLEMSFPWLSTEYLQVSLANSMVASNHAIARVTSLNKLVQMSYFHKRKGTFLLFIGNHGRPIHLREEDVAENNLFVLF